MSTTYTAGRFQAFDSNGDPLSGGKLYTYAAGTTTPKATYTTSALSTPNANPVVLDSTGRATVWLGSGTYRMVLKTAAEATLTDDDNLNALVSTDAPSLTYLPPGTGGVQTTVQGRLAYVAHVADYGAVGDGVTNDSAAIQLALDYVRDIGGGALVFEHGKTYYCTTRMDVYSGTLLDFNGATVDGSALVDASTTRPRLFRCSGTYGTELAITANVAAGAITIPVLASGYAVNDMVIVGSNAIFDGSNTLTRVAEIAIVRSADATTVTLQAPLSWGYNTADDAYIQHLTPARDIAFMNGTAKGVPTDAAKNISIIGVWGGARVFVENMRFLDVNWSCVAMLDCIFSKVISCSFEQASENEALSYGVSFGNASQDCIASNNSFYNRRHAVTTTNASAIGTSRTGPRGISKRLKFQGNVIYRSANYDLAGTSKGDAIDTHGGTTDVEILDNTVYGATGSGINVEGMSCTIIGNSIYGAGDYGIRYHNETDYAGIAVIKNNKVIGATDGGILLEEGFRGAGKGYTRYDVSGNTVENTAADAFGIAVLVDVLEADRPHGCINGNVIKVGAADGISAIKLKNATITGNSVVSGQECIQINEGDQVVVSSNVFETTSTGNRGILMLDTDTAVVSNNTVVLPSGTTSQAINITDLSGVFPTQVCVVGNSCLALGVNTGTGLSFNNGSSYCVASSNILRSFATPLTLGSGTGMVSADNIV